MNQRTIIFICLSFIASAAMADDDCKGHSCVGGDVTVGGDTINVGGDTVNVEGASLTGGDVNFSGSRAYAFGNSLGDVDINDCLASKQWNTPLFGRQDTAPNLWCMGESYDARGLYKMAARMRCKIQLIRSDFATDEDCWAENTVTPQPIAEREDRHDVDEEQLHVEQEQRYQVLNEELEQLKQIINRPAPKPVQRTVVQEKPLLTPEQRSALLELKQ